MVFGGKRPTQRGQFERWQQTRRQRTLADIDDHHAQREPEALRPEGIGSPRVSASAAADVHVPEGAHHHAAGYRSQHVGKQNLDQEIKHGARLC